MEEEVIYFPAPLFESRYLDLRDLQICGHILQYQKNKRLIEHLNNFAKRCHVSVKTIKKHIKKLEDLAYLNVVRLKDGWMVLSLTILTNKYFPYPELTPELIKRENINAFHKYFREGVTGVDPKIKIRYITTYGRGSGKRTFKCSKKAQAAVQELFNAPDQSDDIDF